MPKIALCEKEVPDDGKYLTEDLERYKQIFNELDINKDGRIEISELAHALHKKNLSKQVATKHAEEIIKRGDLDDNAELDFAEFMQYMHEHEIQLKLAFSELDKNKDGHIEAAEVQAALEKLGVSVNMAEAEALTKRVEPDGDLKIDWVKWRDHFGLYSSESVEELLTLWRHDVYFFVGKQLLGDQTATVVVAPSRVRR